MSKYYFLLITILCSLSCVSLSSCASVEKTVYIVKVVDGDTFDDSDGNRYRMYGIDAPEKGQPFGKTAKRFLSGMILNKNVKIEVMNADRYGRSVCKVYDENNSDVGAAMLKAGLAHHFRRYDDSAEYERFEVEAREQRRGLWQRPDVIEPCIWRKMSREERDLHR